MSFDYRKLKGRIKEKVDTQSNFAEELGISRVSLSLKLNGKAEFSQREIENACRILDIAPAQIHDYFFTEQV